VQMPVAGNACTAQLAGVITSNMPRLLLGEADRAH